MASLAGVVSPATTISTSIPPRNSLQLTSRNASISSVLPALFQRNPLAYKMAISLRASSRFSGNGRVLKIFAMTSGATSDPSSGMQALLKSIQEMAIVKLPLLSNFSSLLAYCSQSILSVLRENLLVRQCAPAVGAMLFALWGLGPFLRLIHCTLLHKEDRSWKESQLHHVFRSYVRPVVLWLGVISICRAFDPLVLSTEASQAIKQRVVNFVRSLSTVLAFAYCTTSLTQQLQKVMLDRQDSQDSRSLGAQFVGNAVYTAVWIAALCLFMELLGFSTQKWLTAGGLGTVLLTLAGREIFTNFLSSIMIHATRPFVLNEWIQTKIDGYEVSGTVEHVGWWSPTIVRGDDREAVHIPNHKFTVSVVRNLTQKSHWRIKTHFGISHLDASKIPSIVADMRKVLAKHPQVEQRRLHRRVFFDSLAPESQALMVLVSCFVKTPHFEEYLRVKEVILLDLMKVISHHHARLATPIRSVQRVLDDIEPRSSPFRDMNRSAEAQGRPYLLVEATAVSSGQRDAEQSGTSKNGTAGKDGSDTSPEGSSNETMSTPGKPKPQLEGLDSMGLNSKDITLLGAAFEKPPANIPEGSKESGLKGEKTAPPSMAETAPMKAEKASSKEAAPIKVEKASSKEAAPTKAEKASNKEASPIKADKASSKEAAAMKASSRDAAGMKGEAGGAAKGHHTRTGEQSMAKKLEKTSSKASADMDSLLLIEDKSDSENDADTHALRKEDHDKLDARRPQPVHAPMSHGPSHKPEMDRGVGGSSGTKAQREENLVLGVALDGPKRTLPLDEVAPTTEQKELVGLRNGNSSNAAKERREVSPSPNTGASDARDR